jgi:hypothetical protein
MLVSSTTERSHSIQPASFSYISHFITLFFCFTWSDSFSFPQTIPSFSLFPTDSFLFPQTISELFSLSITILVSPNCSEAHLTALLPLTTFLLKFNPLSVGSSSLPVKTVRDLRPPVFSLLNLHMGTKEGCTPVGNLGDPWDHPETLSKIDELCASYYQSNKTTVAPSHPPSSHFPPIFSAGTHQLSASLTEDPTLPHLDESYPVSSPHKTRSLHHTTGLRCISPPL